MLRRCVLALAGVGTLALLATPAALADGPALVYCYDAERALVQRRLPEACPGEIVDAARAAELARQHRQDRAARFRANQPPPADRERRDRSGSAVFVSDHGHLVTARHVVDGCGAVAVILPDDRRVRAQVVRTADETDLALLKVDHDPVSIVELAPQPGQNPGADLREGIREATAIGFPALGRMVVRPVSMPAPVLGRRDLPPGPVARLVLQARVHAGHSGGPVVDPQGRLIGILVARLDRAAVFAKVGTLPPDLAVAETARSVAALMEAAGVTVTPIGGPGRGLQGALGATVRVHCAQ
jgi:S1-C subfamily serine protease